jgi:nucleoside-diphosphate-sugar epimerase
VEVGPTRAGPPYPVEVTYFLTGATGFLGGVLARQLVESGHRVRAIVRTPAKADALRALGIELTEGDVTARESMRGPMHGVDGVFHVAGWYKIGLRDRSAAERVNVQGTRHVLELMRELRIAKGVYTSTLAVNSDTQGQIVDETYRFTGRHLTEYDRTKAEAHTVAEAFIRDGLPLVIVQPGLIYGPGDTSGVRTTFRQFLERKLPLIPRQTAFAWAHVEDVARGHVLAMERGTPGRSYFLAGPVHTLEEALDLAAAITGIPAPRLRVPAAVFRGAAACVRPIEWLAPVPPAYTSEGLRVICGVTYVGTNARAQRELDWHPRSLRDGLTETLRHEMVELGLRP